MFLSKFSLSLALLGSVAAIGVSTAQAMMDEENKKEVRKTAPIPLGRDHPSYRQIMQLVPSGDLTTDHADAYQQMRNLFKNSVFSPTQQYFKRVLSAREAGIELQNISEVFAYGEVQGWIGEKNPVTKTHFEASRQLNALLKNSAFSPTQHYFKRVLSAREAGIELQNVSELLAYGDVQGWIGEKNPVTKTHFEASRQLNDLFKNAVFPPTQQYFKRVLSAREAGIELQNVSEVFAYGEVNDILGSQPTSVQFKAYQNLKRNTPFLFVTKAKIEDEVKRVTSAQ